MHGTVIMRGDGALRLMVLHKLTCFAPSRFFRMG